MKETILVLLFIVIILMAFNSTMTLFSNVRIRKQINHIISNHNDLIHIMEEENRQLQNRLLIIPNEIITSIEKVIQKHNVSDENMKIFTDVTSAHKDEDIEIK